MSEDSDSGWTKVESKTSRRKRSRNNSIQVEPIMRHATSNSRLEKSTVDNYATSNLRATAETSIGSLRGFFEICVRCMEASTEEYHWYTFDLTTPFRNLDRMWRIDNNESGLIHNSYHDYTSLNVAPILDSLPCESRCAVLESRIFCVGGDDIEGLRDIFEERVGPPITHRTSDYSPTISDPFSPCDISRPDERTTYQPLNLNKYIHSFNGKVWAQLLSPRRNPAVVSIGQRLYLFGGNRPPQDEDEYVPFLEYFDPTIGSCVLAKDPPFPRRIGVQALIVAPLLGQYQEHKILIMSSIVTLTTRESPPDGFDALCVYNVLTDSWEDFDDPNDVLFYHLIDKIGEVLSVAEDDSIYWLSRDCAIYSYNWREKVLSHGTLDGLEQDEMFKYPGESGQTLIHIQSNYFCVVWCEAGTIRDKTKFHVSVFRVFKNGNDLSVHVVGCFAYVVDGHKLLSSAHLIKGW